MRPRRKQGAAGGKPNIPTWTPSKWYERHPSQVYGSSHGEGAPIHNIQGEKVSGSPV